MLSLFNPKHIFNGVPLLLSIDILFNFIERSVVFKS